MEEGHSRNHIMTRWRELSGYTPKMMTSLWTTPFNGTLSPNRLSCSYRLVTVDIMIWFCFSLTWLNFSGILPGGPATFTGLAERLRTWLSVIFCTILYLTARGNWERAIKPYLFVRGCEDMAPVQWLDNFWHLSKAAIALPKAVLV